MRNTSRVWRVVPILLLCGKSLDVKEMVYGGGDEVDDLYRQMNAGW
jgi:hypothetical protein